MSKFHSILSLILSLTLLIGCVNYQEVTVESFNNVNLEKVSPDGIFVKANVSINNPNEYKIKVQAKDLHIFINDQLVGHAKFSHPVELEASTSKNYDIPIESAVPENGEIDLGSITASTLFGGAIKLQIKGSIVGKAKGIKKEVAVDITRSIQL